MFHKNLPLTSDTEKYMKTLRSNPKASIALALLLAAISLPASADLASKLERMIGYVIADSKTIGGWYDEDEKEDGAFKGCKHGRKIVFTDNKVLT